MVGDQRHLCDAVLDFGTQLQARAWIAVKRFDSSAEVNARDISSVNWRLLSEGNDLTGEKLQAASENKTANESTYTSKSREGRAHNFHSYKNDNTPDGSDLAIKIFR